MPDEKKPKPPGPDALEIVFIIIFAVIFLGAVVPGVLGLLGKLSGTGVGSFFSALHEFALLLLKIITVVSLVGIAYSVIKIGEIEKEKIKILTSFAKEAPSRGEMRWRRILSLAASQNPSDWKIAIIEADTILDEMVMRMGYSGENLGDRLKNIEESDFVTLQEAWEAHKMRNRIAHSAEQVSQREVRRVLSLYEKVFQEFSYI